MSKKKIFHSLGRLVPGMLAILLLGAGMGLTANMLRPDGLPLIRKPLRETRSYITAADILAGSQKSPVIPAPKTVSDQPMSDIEIVTQGSLESPEPGNHSVPKIGMKAEQSVISQVKSRADEQTPSESKIVIQPANTLEKPKNVEALFTTLEDAKSLHDKNAALFLDGRLPIDFSAEHIPSAVNLFCEKIDELYEKVLGNVPKDKVIVTYCSDLECTEAIALADALVARGHTNVVIFLEGLPGWKSAGYPTVKKEMR